MAQWNGQFSGLTHGTKVEDIETSFRRAIAAFNAASEGERVGKSKAVHRLAERLRVARLKAVRARLSALREPGKKTRDNAFTVLLTRERQLTEQGARGILKEFNFHG